MAEPLARGSRTIEAEPPAIEREHSSRVLERTLVQVYALSVLYELDGIEKNRGMNAGICEEKEAEGRIFFEIVSSYIADGSAVERIRSLLSASYTELDTETVRGLMREAFGDYGI